VAIVFDKIRGSRYKEVCQDEQNGGRGEGPASLPIVRGAWVMGRVLKVSGGLRRGVWREGTQESSRSGES
jgi:hypothetical protein